MGTEASRTATLVVCSFVFFRFVSRQSVSLFSLQTRKPVSPLSSSLFWFLHNHSEAIKKLLLRPEQIQSVYLLRNHFGSFVHSVASSMAIFWIVWKNLIRFLEQKRLRESKQKEKQETEEKMNNILVDGDMMLVFRNKVLDLFQSRLAGMHELSCFSLGYFIHDSLEMAQLGLFGSQLDIIVHHLLVIMGLAISLQTKLCQSFLLMSLLAEPNSIFLHARKLMELSFELAASTLDNGLTIKKLNETNMYAINRVMLFASFIAFRIVGHLVGMYFVVKSYPVIPKIYGTFGIVGGSSMFLLNLRLLQALIKAESKK